MKYIVLDDKYNFRGLLVKEDVDLFKAQRDMNYFTIYKMSDTKFEETFGHISDLKELEDKIAFEAYGHIIFPDEELFSFEDFDSMHTNFVAVIANFLRDTCPYIKFDNEEYETIQAFFNMTYTMLEESEFMMHNSDEPYEHDSHFRMDRYMKYIVGMFGGKK
jgi:hypothetical protein